MTEDARNIRVGIDERQAAQQSLDAHLQAGRLDPDEYGDRYAKATTARTRGDLHDLFTDLPEPHGQLAARSATSVPAPSPATSQNAPATQPLGGRVGTTLVAISPFVALALFFIFNNWLWFLLVPVVGAIVYAGQRAERDQRRGR